MLLETPNISADHTCMPTAGGIVFRRWSTQAERTVHSLAIFVKTIPGFSNLLLDDRITLMKRSRVEALSILT